MYVKGKKRKTSGGLIALIVFNFIFLSAFVTFSILTSVYVHPVTGALERFASMGFMYMFFPWTEPQFVSYILSGFLYLFMAFAVVYIVVGIITAVKKKRPIVIFGIVFGYLGAFGYMFAAGGYSDYATIFAYALPHYIWYFICAILSLLFALLFIIFSMVLFFSSISEARNNPGYHFVDENAPQQGQFPNQNGPQVLRAYPGQNVQPMYRPLPENQPKSSSDKDEMKSMLREVVRDIVRDEIARNNANQPKNDFNPMGGGTITGATFGGPLVVQYFNGGINSPAQPAAEQKPAEPEPAPQPEPQPEPEPEPVPQPEPQPEPVPQPEPAPAPVYEQPVVFYEQPAPAPQPEPQPEPIPVPQPEPQPEPAPVCVQPAPQPEPVYIQPAPQPEPQPEPIPVPQPEPEPIPEPAPAPIYEQPVIPTCPQCGQPINEQAAFCANCGYSLRQPAPQPAPAPVAAPVVEPEQPQEEKKPIIRIPFTERMLNADDEMKKNYNELKNEILSYGVNSRISNSGDTFRLHRKTYVKITIAGLSLKLYFALEPEDYKDSTVPVQNAGHKGIYNEIPLVFKVRSGLSMRRCKQLIQDVMEKDGLEQGEVGNLDWVEDLRTSQGVNNDEE